MQDVAQPQLLLSPKESPHHFSLLPLQAEQMSQADLFIWVGPDLEHVLIKPIKSLVKTGEILTLVDLPDLTLIEQPNKVIDPHIWLDPNNIKIITEAIASKLISMDPQNKKKYEKNKERILEEIDELKTKIMEELKPIRGKDFIVYHDAFRYFQNAFHLGNSIPIMTEETGTGGVRPHQLKKIIKLKKEERLKCIFAEPQEGVQTSKTLAKQLNLKLSELDPLGVNDPEEGEQAYLSLMLNISSSLKECL